MLNPNGILRQRLKSETAEDHVAAEKHLDVLDESLTAARYYEILQGFSQFHASFEEALQKRAAQGCETSSKYLTHRKKTPLLQNDLKENSQFAAKESLDFSWMDSPSALLGAIYVIEGSTLGGQIIARHLSAKPFAQQNLNFFSGYGPKTADMWRSFLLELEAPGLDHDTAVTSAKKTFKMIGSSLKRAQNEPADEGLISR